jgi:hypothetical protein
MENAGMDFCAAVSGFFLYFVVQSFAFGLQRNLTADPSAGLTEKGARTDRSILFDRNARLNAGRSILNSRHRRAARGLKTYG